VLWGMTNKERHACLAGVFVFRCVKWVRDRESDCVCVHEALCMCNAFNMECF
jgi:hypothetical protein